MELYDKVIRIVDVNLIYCLFPLILTLILIKLIFKKRFKIKKVLNLIRWVIIIYTIITIIHFIIGILLFPDKYTFLNRATGLYGAMYWLLLFSSMLLPFTLLIKKLGTKPWYILLIAIFMKIGMYFERFVIVVTSMHRDYIPDGLNSSMLTSLAFGALILFLQGFVLAILLVGIFELIECKKEI